MVCCGHSLQGRSKYAANNGQATGEGRLISRLNGAVVLTDTAKLKAAHNRYSWGGRKAMRYACRFAVDVGSVGSKPVEGV